MLFMGHSACSTGGVLCKLFLNTHMSWEPAYHWPILHTYITIGDFIDMILDYSVVFTYAGKGAEDNCI